MSQYAYESDAAEEQQNEFAAASQVNDFDFEDDEFTYPVEVRDETRVNAFKILDDALSEIGDSNERFQSALADMLAHHVRLEHLRICYKTLEEDEYKILFDAAQSKNKWHTYILNRKPGSVDKTARGFNKKTETAYKLMDNYPEIFGKLVLTDIKSLSEAFNSLELTDFKVAMKKAMTKEEQAAAEAEKAAEKKALAKAKAEKNALLALEQNKATDKLIAAGGIEAVMEKRKRKAVSYVDDAAAEDDDCEDEEEEEGVVSKKRKIPAKTQELLSKIELLETEKDGLEKKVARLEKEVAQLKSDNGTLRGQLEEAGVESVEGL